MTPAPRVRSALAWTALAACATGSLALIAACSSDGAPRDDRRMTSLDDVLPAPSTLVPACAPIVLRGVATPFPPRHRDVEQFLYLGDPGVVEEELGADGRPVFAAAGDTITIHGPASFATWFPVGGGPGAEPITIRLAHRDGVARFESQRFRPLDPAEQHEPRSFSAELHGTFEAAPDQVLEAGGDDDLWIFIDGRLVLDQGGLHPIAETSVALEPPDPEVTERRIDVFFAERQSSGSALAIGLRGAVCAR